MRGRYQGGSLAGFIIIGVVLTLVLVGGLYGLNRYNAEQTKEVATDEASDTTEKPSSEKVDSDKDAKSDSKQSQNEERVLVPDSEESSDTSGSETSSPDGVNGSTGNTNEELPATGPADAALALLAVFALSFTTAHYVRSRAYRAR